MQVQSLALISGLRIRLCCKLLHESEMWIRSGMAVVYRLAAAAPIRPLAWKLPYAMGMALKRQTDTDRQTDTHSLGKFFLASMFGSMISSINSTSLIFLKLGIYTMTINHVFFIYNYNIFFLQLSFKHLNLH